MRPNATRRLLMKVRRVTLSVLVWWVLWRSRLPANVRHGGGWRCGGVVTGGGRLVVATVGGGSHSAGWLAPFRRWFGGSQLRWWRWHFAGGRRGAIRCGGSHSLAAVGHFGVACKNHSTVAWPLAGGGIPIRFVSCCHGPIVCAGLAFNIAGHQGRALPCMRKFGSCFRD